MAPLRALILAALTLLLARHPARAQDDPAYAPFGDSRERLALLQADPANPATLVTTLFTPASIGPGPYPLAIILHEAVGPPATQPRFAMTYLTAYFLSRGYAVAQPMLRGFGGSTGTPFLDGCNLAQTARANIKDVAAVMADLHAAPQVDMHNIVVAGLGFGGWNALAAAQSPPPGVKAVIAFFPAMAFSQCRQEQSTQFLIAGARDLARNAPLPTFWAYGQSAPGEPPEPQPAMLAAWRAAGARADTLDIGNFMGNPDALLRYPEGLHLWVPRLDSFLRGLSLPGAERSNAYLPIEPPKPTGYATINGKTKLPWGADPTGQAFAAYLTRPMPRVFVIGPHDSGNATWGSFDPLRTALAHCAARGEFCMPYAYDNDVIWPVPPKPIPSHYANIADVNRVPYIADRGRADYQGFLAWPTPRAFVVAPNGWVGARGPDAATSALAQCRARFKGCETYAIDTTVVWQPPE